LVAAAVVVVVVVVVVVMVVVVVVLMVVVMVVVVVIVAVVVAVVVVVVEYDNGIGFSMKGKLKTAHAHERTHAVFTILRVNSRLLSHASMPKSIPWSPSVLTNWNNFITHLFPSSEYKLCVHYLY
jgi:hypothetical protein